MLILKKIKKISFYRLLRLKKSAGRKRVEKGGMSDVS